MHRYEETKEGEEAHVIHLLSTSLSIDLLTQNIITVQVIYLANCVIMNVNDVTHQILCSRIISLICDWMETRINM